MTSADESGVHLSLLGVARRDLGMHERFKGELNPKIRRMFRATKFPASMVTIHTAWCAAALCYWLEAAGFVNPRTARAADFASYGEPVALDQLQDGDILVFRPATADAGDSGHVAIFCGFADTTLGQVCALGGNQSNMVCIKTRSRLDIVCARRPIRKGA